MRADAGPSAELAERGRLAIAELGPSIDAALERWLPSASEAPHQVHESMRYSVLAPGKRLRPALALLAARATGGSAEAALPAACALELVHAFSLVHDDLPAMDDDDLRRGRPTNHIAFGEAVAILAGDALAALAFELIARETPDPATVPALVAELGRAVGTRGMIGGQVLDLEGESQPTTLERVRAIHTAKTAALLRAACTMGPIASRAKPEAIEAFARYGEGVGVAFQIADDLLDRSGDAAEVGKAVGKDDARGKQTWPAAVGEAAARDEAERLVSEAIAIIRPYDGDRSLEAVARYMVFRTR